jgi:3-methyladenine DNA glycosylase AlkD
MMRLRAAFAAAADPERATAMAAYMRNRYAFVGLPAPVHRRLTREALAGLPKPSEADVIALTAACWAEAQREYQYTACDYAIAHVRRVGPGFIGHARTLVVTKSWWDTVDALASRVVGPLVFAHPSLVSVMDEWIAADDIWLARTAILHQLGHGADTDADRLFRYCAARAADTDFFLRKAIGWALRQYSKTDAAAVRRFVADNDGSLSPLSQREALKWLARRADS